MPASSGPPAPPRLGERPGAPALSEQADHVSAPDVQHAELYDEDEDLSDLDLSEGGRGPFGGTVGTAGWAYGGRDELHVVGRTVAEQYLRQHPSTEDPHSCRTGPLLQHDDPSSQEAKTDLLALPDDVLLKIACFAGSTTASALCLVHPWLAQSLTPVLHVVAKTLSGRGERTFLAWLEVDLHGTRAVFSNSTTSPDSLMEPLARDKVLMQFWCGRGRAWHADGPFRGGLGRPPIILSRQDVTKGTTRIKCGEYTTMVCVNFPEMQLIFAGTNGGELRVYGRPHRWCGRGSSPGVGSQQSPSEKSANATMTNCNGGDFQLLASQRAAHEGRIQCITSFANVIWTGGRDGTLRQWWLCCEDEDESFGARRYSLFEGQLEMLSGPINCIEVVKPRCSCPHKQLEGDGKGPADKGDTTCVLCRNQVLLAAATDTGTVLTRWQLVLNGGMGGAEDSSWEAWFLRERDRRSLVQRRRLVEDSSQGFVLPSGRTNPCEESSTPQSGGSGAVPWQQERRPQDLLFADTWTARTTSSEDALNVVSPAYGFFAYLASFRRWIVDSGSLRTTPLLHAGGEGTGGPHGDGDDSSHLLMMPTLLRVNYLESSARWLTMGNDGQLVRGDRDDDMRAAGAGTRDRCVAFLDQWPGAFSSRNFWLLSGGCERTLRVWCVSTVFGGRTAEQPADPRQRAGFKHKKVSDIGVFPGAVSALAVCAVCGTTTGGTTGGMTTTGGGPGSRRPADPRLLLVGLGSGLIVGFPAAALCRVTPRRVGEKQGGHQPLVRRGSGTGGLTVPSEDRMDWRSLRSHELVGHQSDVTGIKVIRDGFVASCGGEGQVRLWDLSAVSVSPATGGKSAPVRIHAVRVVSISGSPVRSISMLPTLVWPRDWEFEAESGAVLTAAAGARWDEDGGTQVTRKDRTVDTFAFGESFLTLAQGQVNELSLNVAGIVEELVAKNAAAVGCNGGGSGTTPTAGSSVGGASSAGPTAAPRNNRRDRLLFSCQRGPEGGQRGLEKRGVFDVGR